MYDLEDSNRGNGPLLEKSRVFVKPVLFLAAILVVAGILYRLNLFRFFAHKDRLIAFIQSLGPWGFAGFVALQAFQVIAAPIPGEATGVLGGFLYGPVLGVALSTVGLTLGSYIAFVLARFLGRPLAERFVDGKTMERFDYLLHHRGAFLVFLLFLFPGFPKDYLCYILGLGHLSTLEFLTIATVGRLFGTTLLTLSGTYLREHQYYRVFALAGAAVVVLFLSIAYKDRIEAFLKTLSDRRRREKEKR